MRFLIRRFLALGGVLIASSMIVFCALYLAPGSPEQFLVQGRTVSPEVLDAIRAQYSLDDPLPVRYWNWLSGVFTGDMGRSLLTQQDVGALLASRIPTTLSLAAYAAALIIICGIGLGIVAGTRGGVAERIVIFASNLGIAVPTFFAALVLMSVFSVGLGWFPVFGAGEGAVDRVWHLTLPALALSLPSIAVIARITRTAIVEESESEHVLIAVARGLPRRVILWRHTVRNSLLPVTTAVGMHIAGLVAGAFVVEYAFTLDGTGALLVNSVQRKDFAVVQAIALIMVIAFGVVNLLVDLLYTVIDPRVRLKKGA
ncbi:ABC transporter permease [Arthrobacter cupressi]|uniref:Peptide/nickel transport system permease protein n=1 Tax=Arthrobacter cupressi TaxID=1045773 RepID=A0A1G8N752_9MICC|nr:ABC transporter permease [Arthrobacter cupressi]NYD78326.1 peptide/nickel transport system permease protein [Arthrobacter cupressi]SDI76032.1 peptide/nickel transport system permease protein [Arthrobacter cupressi]